jgi:hypothetical protein
MRHRLLLVLCAGVAVCAGTVRQLAFRSTSAATPRVSAADRLPQVAATKRSGYIVASS